LIDAASIFLIVVLVALAVVHVIAEVLYKKGGMVSFSDSEKGLERKAWTHFLLSPIVILSLILTMGVKVIYGIALATNPLYLAGGIYLAAIAILSILAGRFFFHETLRRSQMAGFVLVAIGLVMLV
jgi:hypothetical protein